jgi:hypothetical protein
VRAGDGADDVESGFDVGHPVAQRLVERILQRLAAGLDRYNGSAQQVHARDVGRLALHVLAAHVDDALQAVTRADRGSGHTVLACTRLGDDARLAHAACKQRLTDGVVDLVRTGVVEILALEVNLRATQLTTQSRRVIDRAGSSDEVSELALVLGDESRVASMLLVSGLQFVERVDQGFGDEGAAVIGTLVRRHGAEAALGIGLCVVGQAIVEHDGRWVWDRCRRARRAPRDGPTFEINGRATKGRPLGGLVAPIVNGRRRHCERRLRAQPRRSRASGRDPSGRGCAPRRS